MITFEGVEYPTREIIVDGHEYVVAQIKLMFELMNDESMYVEYKNDEAKAIDKNIDYYFDDEEWEMDDEALRKYLSEDEE